MYEYSANGKTVRPWKYEMDEEDEAADATTIAGWFNAVVMPAFGTTG